MISVLLVASLATVLTVAIHITGARGPALPTIGLPVIGAGLYRDVWPLDTLAHAIAGVAIAGFSYWVLAAVPVHALVRHGTVLVVLLATSLVWEFYEVVFWGEIPGSGGPRRWFEDTQADILAVILGGAAVGAALTVGVVQA